MIRIKNNNNQGRRGQAIAEFSIALPVLLLILFGLFEVGRMMFIYSAVGNASRNAVRYASAVGLSDTNFLKYKHCAGIKDVAVESAYMVPDSSITVSITYDTGPSTSTYAVCDAVSGEDADVSVDTGDRVNVTVTAQYNPVVKFLPFTSRTITSSSSRTILGIVDID